MSEEETPKGQWSILEIMGRRIVAGLVSEEVHFGVPMCRIDVPANDIYGAFTNFYGGQAIYNWTPCSEEVSRGMAASMKVNPISVYTPDLSDIPALRKQNEELRGRLTTHALLPSSDSDPGAEYDDER